jgi:hypothetical protein
MPAKNAISKPTPVTKFLPSAAATPSDDISEDPFTHMMAADERGAVGPAHSRSVADRPDPNFQANLTPWQIRRRNQNAALLPIRG